MGRRWFGVAGAAAVAAVAAGSEWLSYDPDQDLSLVVADGVVGAVLLAAGIVAWRRRPDSRVGVLMGGAGLAWFAGTLWSGAVFWHRGPLVHLHLSYPTGRVRWPPAIVTVAAVYVVSAVEPIADDDRLTIAITAAVAAVAGLTFARAAGISRRAGIPALVAALALATALSFGAFNRQFGWQSDRPALWLYDAVVLGAVMILLVDPLRGRWADAVVAGLVVDLGRRSGTGALSDELGRALGDPSLTIGHWTADQHRFIDDAGRTVDIDSIPPGRAATPIEHDGTPVAVLVHDAAVLDHPALIESVTAATRIAVANAQLQAKSRHRVEELAASRRRLVEAADEQQRRIGRELRDEVNARLDRAGAHIAAVAQDTPAPGLIAAIERELQYARVELDELARGIHPPALTDGGLPAALPPLACRIGIPVKLDISTRRLPPAIEAALYFVCSEALTNIAKHSGASKASVQIAAANGSVTTVIADDGHGGADPTLGTGLRGLADRIEALAGQLTIASEPGTGTRIEVTLPADPQPATTHRNRPDGDARRLTPP